MQVLRELWTKETMEEEAKMSYQYIFELRERLEQMLELAQESLEKAQTQQKLKYDRRSRIRNLEVGDEVLIMLPTTENKLLMQWRGPHPITKRIGLLDYRVSVNGTEKTFHINLLKRYIRREAERQNETDRERELAVEGQPLEIGCGCFEDEESVEEDLIDFPVFKGKENVENVKIGDNLSSKEREELMQILRKFDVMFTDLPGDCEIVRHEIPVSEEKIIQSKPYPIPYGIRESVDADIKTMLDLGIIRPSDSPFASPVVVVRKRDGSNRICIDFRKLNKWTIADSEPMPQLKDMFQKLADDKYFTKIDLSKGYWQISMATEDIPKTAFVLHNAKCEFVALLYCR